MADACAAWPAGCRRAELDGVPVYSTDGMELGISKAAGVLALTKCSEVCARRTRHCGGHRRPAPLDAERTSPKDLRARALLSGAHPLDVPAAHGDARAVGRRPLRAPLRHLRQPDGRDGRRPRRHLRLRQGSSSRCERRLFSPANRCGQASPSPASGSLSRSRWLCGRSATRWPSRRSRSSSRA